MAGYTSIMVQAYCQATGKNIQEALADLGINRLIGSTEIFLESPLEKETIESLTNDHSGVLRWKKGFQEPDR